MNTINDQSLKQVTLDRLSKADSISVYVSPNSGLDGLASGLSIYLSCRKLGKKVNVFAKSPTVGDAQKLYGVDKIGKIDSDHNLVIVIEDAVKNVDKVSYLLEGTKLKITVHSLPGSRGVDKGDISFEKGEATSSNVLFLIGYESLQDLNGHIPNEQNIGSNSWIVSVDKNHMNNKFAQLNIEVGDESSFSESTTQLLQELALPIDEDISYNLYAGIRENTENFSPSRVAAKTMEVAAWLIKFGAGKASFSRTIEQRRDAILGNSNDLQNGIKRVAAQSSQPDEVSANYNPEELMPIEEVEKEKHSPEEWLKPPKVYKGSKSFDSEY